MPLLLLIGVLFTFSSYGNEKIAADLLQYKDRFFLIDGWSPIKKDLYVVSDPFCRFCVSDFEKIDLLDAYNIFLIPSDLMSRDLAPSFIDDFYSCKFNSSKTIFEHESQPPYFPSCEKRSVKEKLELINLASRITDLVSPGYVPFYFSDGLKTMGQLLEKQILSIQESDLKEVIIDWNRYRELLAGEYRPSMGNVVISNPSIEVKALCDGSQVNCFSLDYCNTSIASCELKLVEWKLMFDFTRDDESYYFESRPVDKNRLMTYLELYK